MCIRDRVQTDHEFASYQDTVDWYHRRPSLWVEPTTQWGEGAVNLVEIVTTGETMDNIVVFWTPKDKIKAGQSVNYGYKLYWAPLPPVRTPLAQVHATRSGMGGFTEGWARASITRSSGPDVSLWTSTAAAWKTCRKAPLSSLS